ncbi:MAG: PAS domain-containing protein [Bilophila wadsworthia]
MTRQVQNPLTCASPSDEVSEVAASSQRRDTALQRTASSLNLYKIIGDSSSEIVWEQASAPNADCIFSGDPRFACANKCLTVEEAYETVHPDDQPLLRSDIDSLHSGEQDSFSRRIRALGCDGSWIPVDVCARSLRDNNRTPLYLIGGFKGISNLPPVSSAIASSRDPSYPTLSGNVSFPGRFAISDGVERFLGYPRHHFRSVEDLVCLLHPSDLAIVHERNESREQPDRLRSSPSGCAIMTAHGGKSRLGWSSCAAGPVKTGSSAHSRTSPPRPWDLPSLSPRRFHP